MPEFVYGVCYGVLISAAVGYCCWPRMRKRDAKGRFVK